jgi:antibiotic biosynthesis monooxygenase (ABM) superfamily enzyme
MIDEHLDDPSRAPRWLTPVATTLGAWLVAFLVVTALLTIFGDELQQMPLALRALLISGVLVALMVNLVMPVLSRVLARLLAGPPGTRLRGTRRRTNSGGGASHA